MNDRNPNLIRHVSGEASEESVSDEASDPGLWSSFGEKNVSEERFCVRVHGRIEFINSVGTRTRVMIREAVRDGLELESGVDLRKSLEVTETVEAVVDEVGVDEGDVKATESQKLCELQHGVDVAFHWTREEDNMVSTSFLFFFRHPLLCLYLLFRRLWEGIPSFFKHKSLCLSITDTG
ncbi:unnamed protein product [Sphenostylis stenocarpa]|uniref:Uncharacterized protein n=1 Tax=Sphenostylis stenocarpa TaxID=92480 RepID=A0AA86RUU6_9FABA|nr:unnamed protein product [Sphenostylis stenocarpa]